MNRTLAFALTAALAFATSALAQEQAQPEQLPPPAGEMVDVGGYSLHLACEGEGEPHGDLRRGPR